MYCRTIEEANEEERTLLQEYGQLLQKRNDFMCVVVWGWCVWWRGDGVCGGVGMVCVVAWGWCVWWCGNGVGIVCVVVW